MLFIVNCKFISIANICLLYGEEDSFLRVRDCKAAAASSDIVCDLYWDQVRSDLAQLQRIKANNAPSLVNDKNKILFWRIIDTVMGCDMSEWDKMCFYDSNLTFKSLNKVPELLYRECH